MTPYARGRALFWLPLAAFLGIAAVVAAGLWHPADRTVRSAMIGKPLPALALPPLLPDRPGLSGAVAQRGRPRLINVFASWCIPCIAEAPQLMRLKTLGIAIEGVAIHDTRPAVQGFLASNGDPYAAIGDDRDSRLQLALGSSGVPETFVVDGRGIIVLQHVGDIRSDEVAAIASAMERAR